LVFNAMRIGNPAVSATGVTEEWVTTTLDAAGGMSFSAPVRLASNHSNPGNSNPLVLSGQGPKGTMVARVTLLSDEDAQNVSQTLTKLVETKRNMMVDFTQQTMGELHGRQTLSMVGTAKDDPTLNYYFLAFIHDKHGVELSMMQTGDEIRSNWDRMVKSLSFTPAEPSALAKASNVPPIDFFNSLWNIAERPSPKQRTLLISEDMAAKQAEIKNRMHARSGGQGPTGPDGRPRGLPGGIPGGSAAGGPLGPKIGPGGSPGRPGPGLGVPGGPIRGPLPAPGGGIPPGTGPNRSPNTPSSAPPGAKVP
jgi:hypothetical protein